MKSPVQSLLHRCLFLSMLALAMSAASFGQLAISVSFAPPALPVYEQPLCPGDGYIWTPAIGLGTKTLTIIIGCPAPGFWRPKWVTSGLPHGGVGAARDLFFMKATGVRALASMAASTTALATSGKASKVAAGTTDIFSTIARCGT